MRYGVFRERGMYGREWTSGWEIDRRRRYTCLARAYRYAKTQNAKVAPHQRPFVRYVVRPV